MEERRKKRKQVEIISENDWIKILHLLMKNIVWSVDQFNYLHVFLYSAAAYVLENCKGNIDPPNPYPK